MSDFGSMKTRIADELNRGNLTSQISNAVLTSLDYYRRQRFKWNVARTTTTLAADVEFISLPSDFIEADTMILNEGDELDFMQERSFYWIDQNKDIQVLAEIRNPSARLSWNPNLSTPHLLVADFLSNHSKKWQIEH